MGKAQIILFTEFEKIEWTITKKTILLLYKIWKNEIDKNTGFADTVYKELDYFSINSNKYLFFIQSSTIALKNKNIIEIGTDYDLLLTNEILRSAPNELRIKYFLVNK